MLLLVPAIVAFSIVASLVFTIGLFVVTLACHVHPLAFPPRDIYPIFYKVVLCASLTLQNAIIIVTIEKTIQSNNVGSEEQQWGLGQTYAVMVALIPALEVCKQILRILKPWFKRWFKVEHLVTQ